ncbi:MAG: Uncharacterised protein [Pseudidiomarina mangrovi]|nr:MAG: Uncharacterised protein [Pseudidiomarina mangrovi]
MVNPVNLGFSSQCRLQKVHHWGTVFRQGFDFNLMLIANQFDGGVRHNEAFQVVFAVNLCRFQQ